MNQKQNEILSWGKAALSLEAASISEAASRLDGNFAQAVGLVSGCKGKVVVTGLGKSGHVARKIASTLSSTGTPAFFLHPAEALHGDLGMVGEADVLVCLAFGGQTPEVLSVARYARRAGIPVVSITGSLNSELAELSNSVLDGSVVKEACPLNLAPTCSSTVALALGDALAVSVMRHRGFKDTDFANFHPGGSLGKRLTTVSDLMVPTNLLAFLSVEDSFHKVLEAVTKGNFGIAIVSNQQKLLGVITDGDLRRSLLKHGGDALHRLAGDLMSPAPKTISSKSLAIDAVGVMEGKYTHLVVCDPSHRVEGLIRMHDLLAAKIL